MRTTGSADERLFDSSDAEPHRGVQEQTGCETDEQAKCGSHGEVSVGCGAYFVLGADVVGAVVGTGSFA